MASNTKKVRVTALGFDGLKRVRPSEDPTKPNYIRIPKAWPDEAKWYTSDLEPPKVVDPADIEDEEASIPEVKVPGTGGKGDASRHLSVSGKR